MFAVDPHLGLGQRSAATVGGVIATADSGPLSHRYGPVRDQLAGIVVALSDGTIVRSGPGSDQEHAGYELAKLMTGSFGTLGVILSVDIGVRTLHGKTATALGSSGDAEMVCEAARAVGSARADVDALDVAWRSGRGGLLVQVSGEDLNARAADICRTLQESGMEDVAVMVDDAELWARQRAGQRSAQRAVLRLHARPGQLEAVLRLSDELDATVVGRAALGVSYFTLDVNRIPAARAGMPSGASAIVLDLPAGARGAIDPWGDLADAELELMRAIKQRFDPAGICNPGVFVGNI
jgi:glycolate oxidase FAD binding subunit